jgi:class 3 adenylate cyclase
MVFLTAALIQVDGHLQSYTVFFYGIAYVVSIVEVERVWRVSFLERAAKARLLRQLFPASLVPKLISGTQVHPSSHDDVCVFFSDICSFTELTSALGPLATQAIVDEVMLVMDSCVKRCPGVWKVERVGDALVCESGVVYDCGLEGTQRLQRHCANVLEFALLVRSEVSKIINPATGLPLQLRMGVHCGSCAAGLVGNQKMMPHFSLFGDLINCTSRLETTSTPNMIHVSDDVVSALRDWDGGPALLNKSLGPGRRSRSRFAFSYRGVVDLKGLGKKTTYWLLGYAGGPTAGAAEGMSEADSRLLPLLQLPRLSKAQPGLSYDFKAMLDFSFDVRSVPSEDTEELAEVLFGLMCSLFDLNRIVVNPVTLRNFIRTIGQAYKDVPYHNLHHAFCVAQFTAALYHRNVVGVFDVKRSLEMTMFASMIAVICHDVGHDGFNNTFHVNSKSPLAKTYFNQSPLEQHHISCTNAVLGMHACNVFENWPYAFAEFSRNLISNSLLATDMKLHDDVLADFAQYDPNLLDSSRTNFDPDTGSAAATEETLEFNLEQYELLKLSRLILHAADISNSVRPFAISATFVDKLSAEFARQVARERELGLPVAPFMVIPDDQAKARGEIYFLTNIARPYFAALAKAFPACACLVDSLDDNIERWGAVVAS